MTDKTLNILLTEISKLTPSEWSRLVRHVNEKYSSKKNSTPFPSLEELQDISPFAELHCVKSPSPECDEH